MTPFAIPLMVTVPAWLTWQELSLIIFNQLKRFIDFVINFYLNFNRFLEIHT